jgi:hypothetical protein
MSDPNINAVCLPVEYLNTTDAVDAADRPQIVLTVRLRLDPAHPFKPTNLCVTKETAQRMIKDLQRAIRDSGM